MVDVRRPVKPVDLEAALNDPGRVFRNPRDVIDSRALSPEDKLRVLRRWEFEARELSVAEEENMAGGEPSLLVEVAEAIGALIDRRGHAHSAPTKQGGQ